MTRSVAISPEGDITLTEFFSQQIAASDVSCPIAFS